MKITHNNYQTVEEVEMTTYTGECIINDTIYIDYVMIYDYVPHNDEEGNRDVYKTLSNFTATICEGDVDVTKLINEEELKELICGELD